MHLVPTPLRYNEALSSDEVVEALSTATWKAVGRIWYDANRSRNANRVERLDHSEEIYHAILSILATLEGEGRVVSKPGYAMTAEERAQIEITHSVRDMHGSDHVFDPAQHYFKAIDSNDKGIRLRGPAAIRSFLLNLLNLPQAA